jgi:predicted outer membrane repeat protein
MKISIGNKLMNGSRHAALALTVITSLAAGLWVSNAVAVEKNYYTECLTGNLAETNGPCGSTIGLTTVNNGYIGTWVMPTAYTENTLVLGNDVTFFLYSEDILKLMNIRFELSYTTDSINFSAISTAAVATSIGGGYNTTAFSGHTVVPAGSKLALRLYSVTAARSGTVASIRLGGSSGNNINLSVYEALAVGSVIGDNGVEYTDISSAITAAVSGDTVIVTDGVYEGVNNRNIDFGGKNITLKSVSGAQQTTIDCNYSGRAFLYQNGETSASVLEGFTIQNCQTLDGVDDQGGGAIYILNASPSITDNQFIGNYAPVGGAIYAEQNNTTPPMIIEGNRFYGNNALTNGGAIHILGQGDFQTTITNSVFEKNTGRTGGAISVIDGGLNVDRSQFTSNLSSGGGAIAFADSVSSSGPNYYPSTLTELIVTNSAFTNN